MDDNDPWHDDTRTYDHLVSIRHTFSLGVSETFK